MDSSQNIKFHKKYSDKVLKKKLDLNRLIIKNNIIWSINSYSDTNNTSEIQMQTSDTNSFIICKKKPIWKRCFCCI